MCAYLTEQRFERSLRSRLKTARSRPWMAETQVKYGVPSFCPASITETDEAIRAYLADIRAAMELERGARVLGAYLEGPYLAERVKGAHNAAKLRDPELTHYKALTAGFEDEIRLSLIHI